MFLHILSFSAIFSGVLSANILFINLVTSPSHHVWNEALVAGLLEKQHNVTMIGHYDLTIQSNNYTLLKIEGGEEIKRNMDLSTLINSKNNVFEDHKLVWDYYIMYTKIDLNSTALETLLKYPGDSFDLIIIDIAGAVQFYPLIEYFGNPPLVAVSPFSLPPFVLDAMGTHFYPYYPVYTLPYTDKMTLFQRVENVVLYLWDYWLKWRYGIPAIFRMAQKRFGKDISPFERVERHVSALLANYDATLDFPQPLPPNIVPVGGLHVTRSTELTNELREILDNAQNGIIYCSFGTNIRLSVLTAEKKKIFLNTFSKLKQTILWKYDGEDLVVPKNVIIEKWYPQNSILGHKNVKLFITHGGGLSTQETIYYGVPIVGIPVYMDQRNNAAKMEARMLGKKLHMATITEDILYDTIVQVLSNSSYKENIEDLSRKYRDQKETALERAVYWTEYVLRHKDLDYLSLAARDMSLFERHNLDVFGVMSILVVMPLVFLLIVFKVIFKRLKPSKKDKIKEN